MITILDGEPRAYKFNEAYQLSCCDCKLCHLMFFTKTNKGKKVQVVAYRDRWQTDNNRKEMSDSDLDWIIKQLQAEKRRRRKKK